MMMWNLPYKFKCCLARIVYIFFVLKMSFNLVVRLIRAFISSHQGAPSSNFFKITDGAAYGALLAYLELGRYSLILAQMMREWPVLYSSSVASDKFQMLL